MPKVPAALFAFLVFSMLLLAACEGSKSKSAIQQKQKDSFYTDKHRYGKFSGRFIDSVEDLFPSDFCGTVLLYKNGKIYRKAIGFSDRKRRHPMQTDDVFQLASVSKTVTAVAVLSLVQEGKLALDSMVQFYLPDFPYPGVRVRHLLNHRSGLPNYMYYTDTFWKDRQGYMNNRDFYDFMKAARPAAYLPPGLSFSYCNTNYAYLAVLAEKVSGLPFYRFAEERILKPAGMRNSFFFGHKPSRIKARVLTGRYDHYEYSDPYYMDGILGDKSLFSTIDDLFGFHKALSDGRLLRPDLIAAMQEASYRHNVFGGSYGLGFRLYDSPQGQWTYHNGWWRGFWTSFWNRFDHKACFIILTNNKRSSHVDKHALAELLLRGH